MRLHASKLDLFLKATPPLSSSTFISSVLFEPSSRSLALCFSDSSHLLFPNFSPSSSSSPSQPSTAVPLSTAASFLRLLPADRVLFLAAAPLNAGIALRAWILLPNHPRFVTARLTYKKSAPAALPLAHGFGVRLAGSVNYFVVHAPAAGQIWVMTARLEEGEAKGRVSVDLVKCAVVECEAPIYSIVMSAGILVLGEGSGVRVFPLRFLVKGNEVKGRRKGHLAAVRSGDRLFEMGKKVVPNGMVVPVGSTDGGAPRAEGIREEKATRNHAYYKLRCARLRQNSGDLCSFFVEMKCKKDIFYSNSGGLASVKAISIHMLSQKQFLILDSIGDLHLLTLRGTFTASEISADSARSSKYAHIYSLDVSMKVQMLAVLPDISARAEFVWISDGAYSVHMMSVVDAESPEKDGDKDVKKAIILSAAQVIFTSEKVQHIVALSAKTILVLGQGNIFAYSIY